MTVPADEELHGSFGETADQDAGSNLIPIEQVSLGSRVDCENPIREDFDFSLPEPEEDSWVKMSFTAWRTDGSIVDGELLPPAEWVDSQGITAGCEINFQLPELQLTGTARIEGIDRCPPVARGDGRVVTGRFVTRSVAVTIRILLDDDHEIRGTEVHPIWSMDRSDWGPLGALVPGERLLGKDRPVRVVQSEVVSWPVPVYNLETHGEHVYRIGESGILVHNLCPGDEIAAPSQAIGFAQGAAEDAVRNVGRIDHAGRHLSDYGVIAGNQQSKAFREAVRLNAVQTLENPLKTFDHVISGQQVKGFYGIINGNAGRVFCRQGSKGKNWDGRVGNCCCSISSANYKLGVVMRKTTDFTIFWNCTDGQEEVVGIYFYGLFRSSRNTDIERRICDIWSSENGEVQARLYEDECKSVLSVSLKLDAIPLGKEWFGKLEASLTRLIEGGALVAWAGGEDCSNSPEVLNPDSGIGNVYAAKAASIAFRCNDKEDGVIEFLSDTQLSAFWGVTQQGC